MIFRWFFGTLALEILVIIVLRCFGLTGGDWQFWAILIPLGCIIGAFLYCILLDKLAPVKVKVNELFYWHIEREEPPHHAWHHCHEYDFVGEISIIPRIEAIVTAFYLELPMEGGLTLKVKSQMVPPNILSKISPDEPITDNYFFQIRLENEIKMPSKVYVIMEFRRGKSKRKVLLKVNDEYRPRF